jgi:hypothetical protein
LPKFDVFLAAFQGYEKIQQQGSLQNNLLTVIDFSLPSTEERLWVIDMSCLRIVLKSLVAHGRNSGLAYATDFSNENESFKSSLGFYLTGEVYNGKHGVSLRLDGLEFGINHKARERAVVLHGADYVNEKLAQKQGYIGRSLGCPAVPISVHLQLIQLIKNKSCLFIYHVMPPFLPITNKEVYFYGRGEAIVPASNCEYLPCFEGKCLTGENCIREISLEKVQNKVDFSLNNTSHFIDSFFIKLIFFS